AILVTDQLDRRERIERFRGRDAHVRVAQRADEIGEGTVHRSASVGAASGRERGPVVRGRRPLPRGNSAQFFTTLLVSAGNSARTFSMSSWNFRITFSVSRTSSGSRVSVCSR